MTGGTGPLQRLEEMGLQLPDVATPVAAYLPTVRTGDLVHVSGQLPWRSGELIASGKLGAGVTAEEGYACAQQCVLNALAAVHREVGLDQVRRIVKLTVFVASIADFVQQPQVANGASELLAEIFGEAGRHARSAVGVSSLPLDTPVEVEMVVEVG